MGTNMMNDKVKEGWIEIAKSYPYSSQKLKAIEELNELIEAIELSQSKSAIIDEIADVLAMIEQIKYYHSITDLEVNKRVLYKLQRQQSRLEASKERKIRNES